MVFYHLTSEQSIYRPTDGNDERHPLVDWNMMYCQKEYLWQWQDIWMWLVGRGKLVMVTESTWCASDTSGTSSIMEWLAGGDICCSSTWLEGGLGLQIFYTHLSRGYQEQAKLLWVSMQRKKI